MKPQLSTFIDYRNQSIWDSLSQVYSVTLEYFNESSHLCYTKDSNAAIYIPVGNTCKDSFTHELLHIYLKAKGAFIGNYITLIARSNSTLINVLSEELLEHIGNCLDHSKMLEIYLQLGFDRRNFISDYEVPKCRELEIKFIENSFNSPIYWRNGADLFLGKFFAMKACPNLSFNYLEYHRQLRNIDSALYDILETFWTEWETFDIEKIDPFYSYYEFAGTFTDNLESWTFFRNKDK
ncbi:hypothetical protein [Chitinophaga japonensis]|uniref:Uncharacterized protein n=1 Tax=Chitinophaga japonensis TaxID=104662 RepID=A0A562TE92_CHIJA|nr:hypothetical protein [Chitinophaga japonensis]TWI91300.1 hypothetical protein LX66_0666 [Chitinophaga japonensis]